MRRRFLKVVNLFLLIPNYLPFGKGVALHLNKLESPSPKDSLCQVWLKLAQWFWRRRWKYKKFTDRQTDGQTDGRTDRQTTDDRWSEKLTWAFSSGELKNAQGISGKRIKYSMNLQGIYTMLLMWKLFHQNYVLLCQIGLVNINNAEEIRIKYTMRLKCRHLVCTFILSSIQLEQTDNDINMSIEGIFTSNITSFQAKIEMFT